MCKKEFSINTPIPFTRPVTLDESIKNLHFFLSSHPRSFSGNGTITKECQQILSEKFGFKNPLLTSSCTSALEIAALCLRNHVKSMPAEVICPTFTFVSTANSFSKFGFKLRFVDADPITFNTNVKTIEAAITPQTVAVVVMHYAGISADIKEIQHLCKEKGLVLIEDAAQSLGSSCHGIPLGSFGDMACFSFHDTKNCTAGEGGALIINNEAFLADAKIAREKGTNREQFLQGQVDKYTWVGHGGHYLMSELNACYLKPQLENYQQIQDHRVKLWDLYQQELQPLENKLGKELFSICKIPSYNTHNGHIFYVCLKNNEVRVALRDYLRTHTIESTFHYMPLHVTPFGLLHGTYACSTHHMEEQSERLLRLPLFYNLSEEDVLRICAAIKQYMSSHI